MNTDSDEFADIRRSIPQTGWKGSAAHLEKIYGPTIERESRPPVNTDAVVPSGGEGFDFSGMLKSTPISVDASAQWKNRSGRKRK